jgi:hypothetical protein
LGSGGLLCARLEGCSLTHVSPEQVWLKAELAKVKQHDYAAFLSLKEQWPVTPATSDLFTTSLVVLEMHARNAPWLGPGSISPLEAVQKCVARTPLTKVRTMDPAAAEQWIIAQLGNDKLAGKIESAGIDGAQLLEIAEVKQKNAGVALGVKTALAKAPQLAARRSVSTPSDTMQSFHTTTEEPRQGRGRAPCIGVCRVKSAWCEVPKKQLNHKQDGTQ